MRKRSTLLGVLVAATLLAATPGAQARVAVGIGIGLGFPIYPHYCGPYCGPYYYRPYPVYVAPPPVYVQPAPVYVQPAQPVQPVQTVAVDPNLKVRVLKRNGSIVRVPVTAALNMQRSQGGTILDRIPGVTNGAVVVVEEEHGRGHHHGHGHGHDRDDD